uniref:Plastid oxygen-evolving enhancer 1-2 n=1 Tax=Alexandrium fundyense TaxID=2932 RepID=A4UHB8_ALEFU|nr:plastid oxygen-evolving enhancer 1-2 precursor [Alexandrium fundyense]
MARTVPLALILVLPSASLAFVQGPAPREVPRQAPSAGQFLSRSLLEAPDVEVPEVDVQPRSWLTSILSFGAVLGLAAGLLTPTATRALTAEQYSQLTYNQVRGSGLANRCPTVESQGSSVPVKSGAKLTNLCFEPKSFAVEAETAKGTEFVTTKLLTRQTYTLAFINGNLDPNPITLREYDGIHTLPTTVQLPNGQYVPFLFSVKKLVATGEGSEFKPGFTWGGEFEVPSYRTGAFLDPRPAVCTPATISRRTARMQPTPGGQRSLQRRTVFDIG